MKPLSGRDLTELEILVGRLDARRNSDLQALQERIPSFVFRLRELAKALLIRKIHELSQKYMHVSWYFGIEYSLWKAVVDGPQRIDPMEAAELRQLSSEAEGWVHYPETAGEPLFVSLDVWLREYRDYQDVDSIKRAAKVE